MDFTLKTYRELLHGFLEQNYRFLRFRDVADIHSGMPDRCLIMRHDVDRLPENALRMARIESSVGVRSTYYFRMVDGVFDPGIIRTIGALGHEIGYHYEDLSLAGGDREKAVWSFESNLERLREVAEVRTLCMHGSPYSKWDNREIWDTVSYRDYGLVLEPYFDIDYHLFFYITDTGRSWNQRGANLRDVVDSGFDIPLRGSRDILEKLRKGKLPSRIIINTHPQRWFNPGVRWARELMVQRIKNVVKLAVNRLRD